ncbi:hypothetical protein L195_g013535 [Trifolium pratense]|uniref:Uncharacterized protein n=2 Tax=Trifolium pratense TaxID=57577 RepID=A0A2K3PNE8_TRIPR|nr:hypothetical protein L195_g012739 [Trifolium pratense]PNY16808.1 hypothetical protein L195_g013535 [Trifolium pratense]
MAKTKLLLLVLFLAVCLGMCRSWIEDVAEEEQTNSEAVQNADSVSDLARQQFSQSLGLGNDDASQNINYKAQDAASRVADTIKSAASEASDYASQKAAYASQTAADTKEAISGAMTYGKEKTSEAYNGIGRDEIIRMPTDKVHDTYEDAKQKLSTASDKASNIAQNAKDNIGDAVEYGREGAANVYDQGKQKLSTASDVASEKFYDAKDTMENEKDKARNAYAEFVQKISDLASSNDNGYDEAKEKIKIDSRKMYNEAKEGINDMVGSKGNDAKSKIGCGGHKSDETFERLKREVHEAYMTARKSMDEEAKANYEATKEKASEATGNLGAKMRNTP